MTAPLAPSFPHSGLFAPNAALPARTGGGKDPRGEFRGSKHEPMLCMKALNPHWLFPTPSRGRLQPCDECKKVRMFLTNR
eukprot:352536-Chlamydomonas_euryale.AAC.2